MDGCKFCGRLIKKSKYADSHVSCLNDAISRLRNRLCLLCKKPAHLKETACASGDIDYGCHWCLDCRGLKEPRYQNYGTNIKSKIVRDLEIHENGAVWCMVNITEPKCRDIKSALSFYAQRSSIDRNRDGYIDNDGVFYMIPNGAHGDSAQAALKSLNIDSFNSAEKLIKTFPIIRITCSQADRPRNYIRMNDKYANEYALAIEYHGINRKQEDAVIDFLMTLRRNDNVMIDPHESTDREIRKYIPTGVITPLFIANLN